MAVYLSKFLSYTSPSKVLHRVVHFIFSIRLCLCVQMCFEWFTKGQHDLESDVQQQLFKEKILKLEPYEITMNGERQRRRLSPFISQQVCDSAVNMFYVLKVLTCLRPSSRT